MDNNNSRKDTSISFFEKVAYDPLTMAGGATFISSEVIAKIAELSPKTQTMSGTISMIGLVGAVSFAAASLIKNSLFENNEKWVEKTDQSQQSVEQINR